MGRWFYISATEEPPPEPTALMTMTINVYEQYDGENWGNYTGSDGTILPDATTYPGYPSAAPGGGAAEDAELGDWYVDYLTLSVAGTIRNTLTISGGVDDEFINYSDFNGAYTYIDETIVPDYEGEPEAFDTRTITRVYILYSD